LFRLSSTGAANYYFDKVDEGPRRYFWVPNFCPVVVAEKTISQPLASLPGYKPESRVVKATADP
jgi:hypothetical protein